MFAFSFITNGRGDRSQSEKIPVPSSLFPTSDHATVVNAITPNQLGRIRYQDTYWFGCALHDVHIPEGTVVEVLERRGNTWLVTPAPRLHYLAAEYN
ncbi:MAG: NfeD family protein [Synechococcales bacterium]|nr:NfeD family protein [Synechococcales bacterium]